MGLDLECRCVASWMAHCDHHGGVGGGKKGEQTCLFMCIMRRKSSLFLMRTSIQKCA